ncbi:MAG: hypothetical protein EXQ47_05340 [Bryobacterales bacterium]|nr:hypothetical protein [Bryobacterales bacterium]
MPVDTSALPAGAAATRTAATASGITFVCDPTVIAVAGVCDTLNTRIAGLYASTFSNANANIYIKFGSTGLGQSGGVLTLVTYSSFRAALERRLTSANDIKAFTSSVTPTNPYGSSYRVGLQSAVAGALGLTQFGTKPDGNLCTIGTSECYDGIITISSAMQSAGRLYYRTGGTIGLSQFDFYSVVEHEVDEVLGTISCAFGCGGSGYIAPADLFRYHSDGTRGLGPGTNAPCSSPNSSNACFSLDGVQMLQQYNNVDNGQDEGDWFTDCAKSLVQDAVGCPGVANVDISPSAEILVLDVVGYDLVNKPAIPVTALTSVTSDSNGAVSGSCATPPVNASFTASSLRAWVYFTVTGAASGEPAQVQFLRPDGTVHTTTSLTSTTTGFQCFSASLSIKDASAASLAGIWKVRVLWGNSSTPLFSLTFTISASNCTYSLEAGGRVFDSSGGAGVIQVQAQPNCFWTIANAPAWVSLLDSGGGGTAAATFTVAPNSGSGRSGQLSVAGATFTIEQQAAFIFGLSFVGSMPHIAAKDVWTTTFTLVNKGTTSATARLSLFGDPSGALTLPLLFPQTASSSSPLLASSLDRNIAGRASLFMTSGGPQTPPVQVGSAQLSATGNIDGFAVFHLIPGDQEAVVPLETRNAGSYALAFDNTGGVVLGVALQNVSSSFATIPVMIRDDTGAVISEPGTTLSLASSGHTSFVLSQQYPFTANKRGTIEFATPPGGQISVLGIRTTPLIKANGTNTLTLTTIPALANVGTGGGSIAHIATGAGWQTTFVLVNTGATPAQATLKFFATGTGTPLSIPLTFPQTGSSSNANTITQPLAAGASLIVQSAAPASDPAATIGSAQLTTTGNVGGFVIFRYNPNGQEAVVPLETRSSANGFVIAFDNTGGTATGLAVNSVSSQPASVPVIVRDDTGSLIASDALSLAANGHLAFTLGIDKFPVAAGKRGTIEFVAPFGAQIGALGIRIPPALTFTTLPALAK